MVTLLKFQLLEKFARLRHGVSPPRDEAGRPFDLRWRGDGKGALQNRVRLVEALGPGLFAPTRLIVPQQTHTTNVAVVDANTSAAPGALANTDAVCTVTPGIPMLVQSADCGTVLVFDPAVPVLGLAHAGWRGTAGRIVQRLLGVMQRELGAEPVRCFAALAPCAGGQAYEVGPEVAEAFCDLPGSEQGVKKSVTPGKYLLDIVALNFAQLVAAGVPERQIEAAGICTITDPGGWFSHRRDGADAGRFALVGGIVPA